MGSAQQEELHWEHFTGKAGLGAEGQPKELVMLQSHCQGLRGAEEGSGRTGLILDQETLLLLQLASLQDMEELCTNQFCFLPT